MPSAAEILRAALAHVSDQDDVTAALADALDMLASETGENTIRHAAAIIRGARHSGRKPLPDDEALQEIADLQRAGRKRSDAVSIVARRKATAATSAESVAKRLRGKLRKTREIDFVRPDAG